jgi:L-fuconolactonase
MIIDAHQHFWKFDPVRDAWIDESMAIIRRDFLPPELKAIYHTVGVDGCVSVQADQSEDETRYLLRLADEYSFIKAVVGWVDFRAGDIEDRLGYFSEFGKLAGFRSILQAEEPERMLEPQFIRGIKSLAAYNFTYDILIYPRHLDAAIELVRQCPGQPFVLDHLAKPDIKNSVFEPWGTKMRELAGAENVMCKVSGLITEADWNNWKAEDMKPYLDHIFDIFGTKRLMFGSDWPVCLLAGSYERTHSIITDYLREFSEDDRHDVLGSNAARFYRITIS